MKTEEIIIDAENRSLGRVAAETASRLRGKTSVKYLPNIAPKTRVKVINLSKIKITGAKLEQKTYKKYSGYPGNLRYISMEKLMAQNPRMLFKKTVKGMLPKNKLAKEILKNLTVEL